MTSFLGGVIRPVLRGPRARAVAQRFGSEGGGGGTGGMPNAPMAPRIRGEIPDGCAPRGRTAAVRAGARS